MSSHPPHSLPTLESFVEILPVPPQQERRRGVVRFVGLTDFAAGEWVGVELVGSEGRNDGSVKGQSYFKCLPGQGVFVRPNFVIPYGGLETGEMDKAPDSSLAKIEDLEVQLAAARQRAAASADAQAKLSDALGRVEAELNSMKAAETSQKTANDDDGDLAIQVRLEEERFELQKLLEASQAQVQAAEQRSEDARAQLQAQAEDFQKKLAMAQADLSAAVAAAQTARAEVIQAQQQPSVVSTITAELEALRRELQRSKMETQRLRSELDDLTEAQGKWATELGEPREQLAAVEDRAHAAEKHLEEEQSQSRESTAEVSSAHTAILAALRAELDALKVEKASVESSKAAELRVVEDRLLQEKEAALRERDAESMTALAAAHRERDELQELCQLLEDELKEEKSQSDELARLVEQLGSEKASAQAAVDAAQQQTVQERSRLRREVEEARAREVRLMTAVEDARQEKDAALQQVAAYSQHLLKETEDSTAATDGGAAKNASVAALLDPRVEDVDGSALLSAALEKCRNDLDEAKVRIMQLTSTQQVARELQQRCDELSRAMQQQRLESQKRLEEVQNAANASQAKATAEVTLWKRQCVAAQRNAVELANTVAELQQQLSNESPADYSGGRHKALPHLWGSRLDAVRERRYEERIAALTRQLLEYQSSRILTMSTWPSFSSQMHSNAKRDDVQPNLSQSPAKLLDFSSPEACVVSTQSLFLAA
ncbi:hypothetical protein ABL78_7348 [Leptomonas seymouri]|uniref:CAP-Gly domain-containing protein n=1 Tax=Leptomonas seymouri TaxID=5684 RepID=A0A0N1HSH8_LEPSE|nr:hypothetical protein ABL78_7348 [Leptomonas seymouri]|eukprot:KPI83610.1 hypothetical protein ABL78_7348 [Leptomonas seymouri]